MFGVTGASLRGNGWRRTVTVAVTLLTALLVAALLGGCGGRRAEPAAEKGRAGPHAQEQGGALDQGATAEQVSGAPGS